MYIASKKEAWSFSIMKMALCSTMSLPFDASSTSFLSITIPLQQKIDRAAAAAATAAK